MTRFGIPVVERRMSNVKSSHYMSHNKKKQLEDSYSEGIATGTKHCYRGADKSLARPTSRCILFDGENISFDASLVIYI